MLLKREADIKAKTAKKLARKQHKIVMLKKPKRKIPKNLVRGASKDPSIFQAALEIMRQRKKERKAQRKGPKHMEIDGTKQRAEASRSRAKLARKVLVDKRRAMEVDDLP